MSWVGKFYGYKALRTHPTPFILFSFLKRLSLWTDITCFWGWTLIWIHCTYFGWCFEWTQNATPRSWLKTFCISKRKSWGCGIFISRSQYSYRHERTGINIQFLLLYGPISFPFAVNTFNFSWPHLNGRQNNSCPILELLFHSQAEYFSRSVNQSSTPAVLQSGLCLSIWVSTINSYLFSRPTISSLFLITCLKRTLVQTLRLCTGRTAHRKVKV